MKKIIKLYFRNLHRALNRCNGLQFTSSCFIYPFSYLKLIIIQNIKTLSIFFFNHLYQLTPSYDHFQEIKDFRLGIFIPVKR